MIGVGLSCQRADCQSAKQAFKDGEAAEARQDLQDAYEEYGLALSKANDNITYRLAVERVRVKAATAKVRKGEALEEAGNLKEALVEFFRALAIDPGNALAAQDIEATKAKMDERDNPSSASDELNAQDLDRPGPPVHLDPPSTDRITVHMTEQSDVLFQTIGKLSGLSVLIDPDFVPKRITIDLSDATVSDALRVLSGLSHSFWVASTHNSIYVAPDTRAKRTQLDELAVETFYLSNAAQQSDINDITTTLRNVLAGAKIYAVASQNAIVVRGTPDELLLGKSIITSLDRAKPEVLVDVYIMEVSRDKLRNIGISPPTSLTVTSNSSSTLNQLGRSSSYSYSIGQAQLEMLLTDSQTQILQNPSVRCIDGEKASLKIGERIPVATGSYSTATSATTSAVQTQFQYIDVGVNLDLLPTIHEDRDVTLKLSVEVSSQTATDTIDGVAEPVISQEKADQVVRLKDGEVSVLAGLVKRDITHSVSGTPGVGEVPLLKYMFTTQQNEVVNDELVFVIIPHVVRAHALSQGAASEIDTGSGDAIQLERIPPRALPKAVSQPHL